MIFATDLDRTLIFSNKFLDKCKKEVVCVEEKDNKPISYMTIDSIQLFESLKKCNQLKIIPVTTRSVAEYHRIQIIKDCKFAITSNGATILYNGRKFLPWSCYIEDLIEKNQRDFELIKNILNKYLIYFEKEPKIVDNAFFFVKVLKNEEKIKYLLDNLEKELKGTNWQYTLQGYKLYIILKDVTKENALIFLKKYLGEDYMITSGDGKLDYDFLKLGDIKIIPEKSEVLKYIADSNFVYKSIPFGLEGTIDLLNIIQQNLFSI